MGNYSAIIVKLEDVKAHPNADRVKLASAAGEPVVIGLDHQDGDIGIFFPAGTVISEHFLLENKQYRKNPVDGTAMGGYFEANGRVRFQKFRGEWSRGFWIPIESLDYLCLETIPVVGTEFQELGGHELVKKYVEPSSAQRQGLPGKPRSKKYENFYEIGETPKLVLNYSRFDLNDVLVITEKLHGTSGRTGCLKLIKQPVKPPTTFWEKVKARWENFWFDHFNLEIITEPEWAYVTGTRRMVLGENSPDDSNYRVLAHEQLKPHLTKGMIVYYELVGEVAGMKAHTPHGIEDKILKNDLLFEYGDEIKYTYGVPTGMYELYIYKIVIHDVEDRAYVFSWDQLVTWCKLHGFKHVPVLGTMLYTAPNATNVFDDMPEGITEDEWLHKLAKDHTKMLIDFYCEPSSILDDRHPREGVVVQTKYGSFKHKSSVFCLLEDIRPYSEPEDDVIEDEQLTI